MTKTRDRLVTAGKVERRVAWFSTSAAMNPRMFDNQAKWGARIAGSNASVLTLRPNLFT